MAEKKDFLNWVGFREESERPAAGNPVDRIRELEAQLSDLRSRRDITSLSKEEFEILATETAMTMIKSAQAREAKSVASAERLISESTRNAKDVLEGAESKARSILSGAEARGRKYISTAEAEATDLVNEATREAEAIIDTKRREAAAVASAARREGERIVADAANEVIEYRRWLAEVFFAALFFAVRFGASIAGAARRLSTLIGSFRETVPSSLSESFTTACIFARRANAPSRR